jgi:hypothetical protein
MQFAVSNGNNHFAAHYLPFVVSIGVTFAASILVVVFGRRVERASSSSNLS